MTTHKCLSVRGNKITCTISTKSRLGQQLSYRSSANWAKCFNVYSATDTFASNINSSTNACDSLSWYNSTSDGAVASESIINLTAGLAKVKLPGCGATKRSRIKEHQHWGPAAYMPKYWRTRVHKPFLMRFARSSLAMVFIKMMGRPNGWSMSLDTNVVGEANDTQMHVEAMHEQASTNKKHRVKHAQASNSTYLRSMNSCACQ